MGLDVMYLRLRSATTSTGTLVNGGVGGGLIPTSIAGSAGNTMTISDQGNWTVRVRAHKDFYP